MKSKCPCGRMLNYPTTPYLSNEKRVCACGRIHNVDPYPVDWDKIRRRIK